MPRKLSRFSAVSPRSAIEFRRDDNRGRSLMAPDDGSTHVGWRCCLHNWSLRCSDRPLVGLSCRRDQRQRALFCSLHVDLSAPRTKRLASRPASTDVAAGNLKAVTANRRTSGAGRHRRSLDHGRSRNITGRKWGPSPAAPSWLPLYAVYRSEDFLAAD